MTPTLTAAQTRTLVALVLVYERDGRATVRSVAEEGGRDVSTTHRHVWTLRRLGLASWDDHRSGTLRPTVERVPFGEVGP